MERISKMWRSGLAMILALCMIISACPVTAFAAANEINYVSIGDSMANGYGFEGYEQTSNDRIVYDFMTGKGMYGEGAYPLQFEDHLTGLGYSVNHTKLATSAMLAEDLLYLLGGREYFDDGWNGYKDYVGTYTDAEISAHVQEAVKEADVITMGIGNAAFGAFLMHKLTDALGVFGAHLDEDEKVNFEDAISILELDAEQYALVMKVYNSLESKLVNQVPADLAAQYNLGDVVDLLAYTTASYVVNYKALIEQMLEMNPDVEIVLVGLLNTTYGMNVTDENGNVILPFGDVMDSLFGVLNAYMAGLPAVLQAQGIAPEAKLYYASQPNPKFICQEFENLLNNNWVAADSRLDVALIRQRNIDAFNGDLAKIIGEAVTGDPLVNITLADVKAYESLKWEELQAAYGPFGFNPWRAFMFSDYMAGLDLNAGMPDRVPTAAESKAAADKILSVAIYLAIEKAVAKSTNTMEIPLSGLMKIAGDLSSVFTTLGTPPTDAPESTRMWLMNGLSTEETQGMCKIYGLFKVGNGMSVHPTPAGHDDIAASVIAAYKNNTVQKETNKNIQFVLGEMEDFLKEYGPQAADQLVKVWNENDYQDIVNKYVGEVEKTATERYEYYKNTVVPALTATADELNGQKAELVAQLNTLNAQLIVKKAELEKVISEQEIGSIYNPDINIDTELGNNQQTEVPENDCEGTGNVADELAAAVSDLEHAIAVVEALIADVSADIDDMVALATEIAAAIAELEKTVASVAAAAMDLKEAFDAVYAILTDENADATAQSFIDVFNTSRKAAETAAVALELVMKTANDDVAAIDASLTALTNGVDELYANFDPAHAESALMGVQSVLPKEVQFGIGAAALILQDLEVDKQAVMDALDAEKTKVLNKLNEDILALGQKYDPEIAAAAQAVEDKKNEMQAAITAKYTEYEQKAIADINALNDQANAQLAILNQELAGYQAELAALADDAAQEVRDGIQAQIDRVNGDIAKVNEDLACAVEHVNTELKAMHDKIVAEVSAEFDAVIAELQKIHDDLVDAYNAAVDALKAAAQLTIDELTAAADEEIQKLIDAANKKIDELGDLADEVKDSINNIFQDIHDEISAAQNAINDILHGDLDAIEDLKEALNNLGLSAVSALVDELTDLIKDLVHQATYADLNVDDGFLYVALGDDTALSEGYVELVAEKIEEEKNLEKGVDILFKNYAKAGNTIGKERENLSDVAEADLITIGFGNANMLKNAIAVALSGQAVSYDWTALVGEQVAPYVQEALAEVYAEIDAAITDADMNTAAKAAVEGLAYNAVEYAVELPQLIAEIREVNEDALIIIVGQYNPMNGAVLDLMGNTMDLNEYIDYFVDAVAVHGIAYSLISGDAIFAEAPDVDILETDTKWSVLDLLNMLQNGFATLNPSEAGDTYIANQILKALNITQLNEVPEHFFKDVTDPNAYYYEAVKWAVKMGITNGYGSPDIFAPDVACNRAQIVTFLWRAAGCPAPKSNVNPFKDVVDGEYYTEAVLWAVEKGITKGYGAADIFAPDVICNRAQIVTMLNRYLGGAASSSNNPFVDVPAGQYYTEAVLWAAQKGITTGTSATTFEPEADCTRGQIVTFLYRALYQHR